MKTIKIEHIGKTEGHLGFEGALQNGDMASAKVVTLEGARMMEGIVLNRSYYDVPIITSRICGICPIVHNLASVKALENALNIKPTPEIILLRKIFNIGQIIHSHALHFFFLSFPDFIGISNNFDLVKKYPRQVQLALDVRDWGIKITDIIGGRTTHPVNSVVGGFKVAPDKQQLDLLYQQLEVAIDKAIKAFDFVQKKSKVPDFQNPTNFVSLKSKKEYAHYGGDLYFSDSDQVILTDKYVHEITEITIPYEAVKRAEHFDQTFMVGALARINNNFNQLNPLAKKAWKKLDTSLPCYNTFYNNLAQAVEVIHLLQEAKKLLAQYLKFKKIKLFVDFKVNSGRGVGAIEAPRGTLYHYYELNNKGNVKYANIITPTAQFIANMEDDLKILLPGLKGKPDQKQKKLIKTLIRAYDPCISCATH